VAAGREISSDKALWPLIVAYSDGTVNTAAVLGSSLWRWSLLMKGIENETDVYLAFINNLVRWLQTERKKESVNLSLSKSSYHFGEPVPVRVQVYDSRFAPVSNAEVLVTVQQQDQRKTLLATPTGQGLYELNLNPERPGEYAISVIAQKESLDLGTAASLFSVGEYSEELSALTCQAGLLQNLSLSSGGRYVPLDSLALLAGRLPDQTLQQMHHRQANVWNHWVLLLLIITCLTGEWWLRKWKGMV